MGFKNKGHAGNEGDLIKNQEHAGSVRRVAVISHFLGAPSEQFIYRQLTGCRRYEATAIVHEYLNRKNHPFPRVLTVARRTAASVVLARLSRLCHLPLGRAADSYGLLKAVRRVRPSLIHFQQAFIPLRILDSLSRLPAPFLITGHGTDVVNPIYHKGLRQMVKQARLFICVSDFIRRTMENAGCDPVKLVRHYIGVPLPEKVPSLPENRPGLRIACIGRLTAVKDHVTLLRAMAAVPRELSVTLELVGDGELLEDCKNECSRLGIRDRVVFHGAQPAKFIYALIASSHCVALTSRRVCIAGTGPDSQYQEEGLGLALVEGAACGRPLLGTKSGGIPEVIEDNKNGFLVNEGDYKHLAHRITELATNRSLQERMGVSSRSIAEQRFNLEKQMLGLEHLYDTMLSGGSFYR